MKLTEWYPGHIKPARVGVYQRDYGHSFGHGYAYWDGRNWKQGGAEIWDAVDMASWSANGAPSLPWRGLSIDIRGVK